MRYIFCLLLIAVLCGLATTNSVVKVSPRLRKIICRKCFGRMYRYCSARMRLTKRSVGDVSSSVNDHHSRPKRAAYRKVRIQLRSCSVCRDVCYKKRI